MLTRHLDGIVHSCHENVPFGTVDAINGNIRAMLHRGRGYRHHAYAFPRSRRPPPRVASVRLREYRARYRFW
jgi:Transposase